MTFFLMACQEVAPECLTEEGSQNEVCTSPETDVESDEVVTDVPDNDEQTPIPSEPEEPTTDSVAISFKTNVKFFNFDQSDKDKVNQALRELKAVVKSPEFKYEVLRHTYNGAETFVNNNGLTNAEVYQTILRGAETLLPDADNEMDLELQLYYKRFSSTVGYTYPGKLRIYMNTKFFDRYETEDVANNVMHEWLHKLGFGHDSKRTARRPYSVPYAVGNIIEDLIIEMRKSGQASLL